MRDGEPVAVTGPMINVDLSTLRDAADTLAAEVSANVAPRSRRLIGVYEAGVPFGSRSPGATVRVAAQAYQQRLVEVTQHLAALVTASAILVEAAREVVAGYHSVDAMWAANAQQVAKAFNEAVSGATAVVPNGRRVERPI
jgi:hypothetical protein